MGACANCETPADLPSRQATNAKDRTQDPRMRQGTAFYSGDPLSHCTASVTVPD